MSSDTALEEIVVPEWPVATPEDEVRSAVRRRARRIRLQRSAPIAALGLSALVLFAAVSLPNGTQPSSVRTADNRGDDEGYMVDEDRTAEQDGTGANAKARVKSGRDGTSAGASGEARKDGETVYGGGAEVGNQKPMTALTGHPLVRDQANDDAALTGHSGERVHGEHQPAADLLTADIVLDGADLVFTSTVEDISQMRQRPRDNTYTETFSFNHDGSMIELFARFDSSLGLLETEGTIYEARPGHYAAVGNFDLTATTDEGQSLIILRASLSEINRALSSGTDSEDIAVGSRLSMLSITTAIEVTTETGVGTVTSPHSDFATTGYDEYWAVGS